MISGASVRRIDSLISCGSHDAALTEIQKLVDWIFCEPINVGMIFGSRELDKYCQIIGSSTLDRLGLRKSRSERCLVSEGEACVVYLVSRLHVSGGHTAALHDLIRLSPRASSVVIVTGTCGPTDRQAMQHRFSDLDDVALVYAPRGSRLCKLEWIQKIIAKLSPRTVWLFNHHQDSVAIAAVQPDQSYSVRYYHHGDHQLCLGVHLDYAEHCDPHPMGFHNCKESLGITNISYLPLIARDLGARSFVSAMPSEKGLTTCTVGRYNKVEVPYYVRYVDVVPELLRITGGRHIHIGKLTPIALRRIRHGLRMRGINPDSFVYVSYVPSVWRALHDYGVDVYVASFPFGAGKTLIEVMGAGIPAVIHKHCSSRMLGGFDMAYPGAFTWSNPSELYEFFVNVDRNDLASQSLAARAWYDKYHSETILKQLLSGSARIDVPVLRGDYRPDMLMQSIQVCRDVTLMGVLNRMVWRHVRRLKSSLGLLQ